MFWLLFRRLITLITLSLEDHFYLSTFNSIKEGKLKIWLYKTNEYKRVIFYMWKIVGTRGNAHSPAAGTNGSLLTSSHQPDGKYQVKLLPIAEWSLILLNCYSSALYDFSQNFISFLQASVFLLSYCYYWLEWFHFWLGFSFCYFAEQTHSQKVHFLFSIKLRQGHTAACLKTETWITHSWALQNYY